MHLRTLALLCSVLLPATAQAALDLNINDHALRMIVSHGGPGKSRETLTDYGLLYVEDRRDNSAVAIHAGLHTGTDSFRLGGRLLFTNPDIGDALVLGLGGQGRLWLGRKASFAGHLYYAPEITSAMDATGYREFAVRLAFRITRSDDIYVGYRSLEVSIGDAGTDVEIDEDLHVGMHLHF